MNPRTFNPRHFNRELFNHEFLNHGVEKLMVEKSGVEKSRVEMSFHYIKGESQNLLLINHNFKILSSHFFGIYIMAIRVVEFSNGGYKIRKIFA